jgi:hypothetical protein
MFGTAAGSGAQSIRQPVRLGRGLRLPPAVVAARGRSRLVPALSNTAAATPYYRSNGCATPACEAAQSLCDHPESAVSQMISTNPGGLAREIVAVKRLSSQERVK